MWSVIPGICPHRSSRHGMSSYTDTAKFPSRFRRVSVLHPSSVSCRSVIGPFAKKKKQRKQFNLGILRSAVLNRDKDFFFFHCMFISEPTCRTGFMASMKSLYSIKCLLVVANMSKTAWSSVLFVGKSETRDKISLKVKLPASPVKCNLVWVFRQFSDTYEYVTFRWQIPLVIGNHLRLYPAAGRNRLFVTS